MLPVSEATVDRSCHKLGGKICSQNEKKLSISREKTHVLHQIGVDIAAETNGMLEISCGQQNLPANDTYMTLPANRGLGQRTPASSIHMDKGLENQRVRTTASACP